MLLGVYFGNFQLGLDPFLLLRDAPSNAGLTLDSPGGLPTAFSMFQDGQGRIPCCRIIG